MDAVEKAVIELPLNVHCLWLNAIVLIQFRCSEIAGDLFSPDTHTENAKPSKFLEAMKVVLKDGTESCASNVMLRGGRRKP